MEIKFEVLSFCKLSTEKIKWKRLDFWWWEKKISNDFRPNAHYLYLHRVERIYHHDLPSLSNVYEKHELSHFFINKSLSFMSYLQQSLEVSIIIKMTVGVLNLLLYDLFEGLRQYRKNSFFTKVHRILWYFLKENDLDHISIR